MFIKIGGQENLNKKKKTYELSHTKPIRSTMIGAMYMNLRKKLLVIGH
jgi:hypothetical protein